MDTISAQRRSDNMRSIRSRNTSPEMIVRRLVHGMGFRYRLHVPSLPGKPDLVFARLRRIIEVRGCFWHQHRDCIDSHLPKSRVEYWGPKLRRNCERDKENERQLRHSGWRVLIIWECQATKDTNLARRIERFLGCPI